MKKMISIVALAAISTSASAFDYKINVEGRADFINDSQKTTAASGTVTTAKSNDFLSSVIRLNMAGNINEQLTYRIRYRFNKEGTSTSRRDDSTSALDLFYVDHKNSLFTTRFGKMNWAEAFGRESFLSSTDRFLSSDAFTAYNNNIGEYRFGAAAMYTFLETNKLTLAVSNPNTIMTDTTSNTKNNSLAYAVHYSSVLFDKAFQPLLSYTTAGQDADAEAATPKLKANYKMMVAGFRTEAVQNLIVDLDWKRFNKEKTTATAVATDGKTSSIFANVAYTINDLTPFIQYVNDKFKSELAGANADYKKNSFAAGVMFKPFNDVNFRYHLLYTHSNQKFDSAAAANSKVVDNKITFGIKADI